MVLSLMRKHAKSYLIKFMIALISLVFIFYFGFSLRSREVQKVAMVNGEAITEVDYHKAYRDLVRSFRNRYGDLWDEHMAERLNLKSTALNNLINQKLISEEARRLGFGVTEAEIQKFIMSYPAFQVDGKFDKERYRSMLNRNQMSPEDFEALLSRDILEDKIKQFLLTFVPVTKQELRDQYTYANEEIKISYVVFKAQDFKQSVTVDQGAMREFFKEHRNDYRIPEKVKAAYVLFDPRSFRNQVQLTEEEIRSYYEYHLDRFKVPKRVRARHIFFPVPENAGETQEREIRDKAKRILNKARQGADFSALAREYSQDPSSRAKGGDLGYITKGDMAESFEKAAFALNEGEISDLVRTSRGYHIIKVEDIKEPRTKPMDQVRKDIISDLTREISADKAHERCLSFMDHMPYEVDLPDYAKERGLEVHYTDFFSKRESPPGLKANNEIRQTLFSLQENETTDLVELNGKFYIFQVTDRKSSYLPEMEEVLDQVRTDFINDRAAKKATAAAKEYLNSLRKGRDWEVLASKEGLSPSQSDYFTRLEGIPKIGHVPGLIEEAFSLGQDQRYPKQVFDSPKGAIVIRWEGKKRIDEEAYQKNKEQYRLSLMRAKHQRVFQQWVQGLRQKAEIEILIPISEM